jgi:hypothetical protein
MFTAFVKIFTVLSPIIKGTADHALSGLMPAVWKDIVINRGHVVL